MSKSFGEIRQLGFIVHDVGKAMKFWTEAMGVGPFFHAAHVTAQDYRHRGEAHECAFAVGLANSGAMQIELLQPLGDTPSMWREFLDGGREGFQHVAFWTEDYDAAVAEANRLGYTLVHEGVLGGGRFSYFDTHDTNGAVVELSEYTGEKRVLFDAVRQAAVGWDGSNPIRTV